MMTFKSPFLLFLTRSQIVSISLPWYLKPFEDWPKILKVTAIIVGLPPISSRGSGINEDRTKK